jgi:hypothetical protein
MLSYKKNISILFISLALVACSKGTGIDALDELLVNTQTTLKDRTPEWYVSQDRIRSDVIDTCSNYFKDQVFAKANAEDPNLPRIVYDMNQIETEFEKIQDCKNALAATNAIIKKEHDSKTLFDSEVAEAQYEFGTTTTNEEIEQLSAIVANNLSVDQQNTEANEVDATKRAEEYLAPEGKLEQIMNIDNETLNNADKSLSEFSKDE